MKKIFAILTLSLSLSAAAFAQNITRTAYFLDGYDYSHMLNPAMPSARSYLALPIIGGTSFGLSSNIGVSSFINPTSTGTALFTSPNVSSETFLSNLSANNYFQTDLTTNILSLGIWNSKKGNPNGFTTLGVDMKVNAGLNLPYDLFSMVKSFGESSTYSLSDLGVRAKAYAEIYLGHTQRLGSKLTIGGKVKFLVGLMNVQANVDNLNLTINEEQVSITTKGTINYAAMNMVSIPTNASGALDLSNITTSTAGISPSGYGVAVDLGATFTLFKGFTLSASILDLGAIKWNNNYLNLSGAYTFTGFDEISLNEESDTYISTLIDNMTDDFDQLYSLYDGGQSSDLERLAMTLHVGAQYKMPFWSGMSLGVLYTKRFDGIYSWSEGRASLNFAFGNLLALSGSYALTNYGSSVGAALNLHCRALSVFLSADSIPTQFTTTMLPLNPINFKVDMGVVFNLSKRKDKGGYVKKVKVVEEE